MAASFFLTLLYAVSIAQLGPATAAGVNADAAAAARRVMMHALQGGNQGGCHPLPAGWATLSATVAFPSSYGGYSGWVNGAELLPVSDNLSQFLKSHSGGHFYQPAWGGSSKVQTSLCAPAGFTYWLIVDSGTAKVAIGRVTLLRPGRTYHVALVAPPIGRSQRSTPAPAAASSASWDTPQAEATLRSWLIAVPSMGMSAWEITPDLLRLTHARAQLWSVRGIVIGLIDANGRGASAGLRRGDVVLAVNGHSCATVAQFAGLVARFADALEFSLIRDTRRISLRAPVDGGWKPPVAGPGFVPPASPRP